MTTHLQLTDTFRVCNLLDSNSLLLCQRLTSLVDLSAISLAHANGTFMTDAMGPETIDEELSEIVRYLRISPAVKSNLPSLALIMTQQQPVSEQTLSQDIMDCPSDSLGINADALTKW